MARWPRGANGLPEAWVLGDLDLVRPLQLAGIPCAVVAPEDSPARYRRHTRVVEWHDPAEEPERLLDSLLATARTLPERPVLFYQLDSDCSFVSDYREPLSQCFDFVVSRAELVQDCLDKARFLALAQRLQLRVPASQAFLPVGPRPIGLELDYPIVLKPALHGNGSWITSQGKAVAVSGPARLAALWPDLVQSRHEVIAQELVPGPETRIESYHAYRRPDGEIAGEFTGRKLRTYPLQYGHSTAVTVTDIPDVRSVGREITERMGVEGVLKLDFKRAPDGRLVLLEANLRFNLWHHPGAYVGVNLPAMVWSDLTGLPAPRALPPHDEAHWMSLHDVLARREWGVPAREWLPWAWRCEAKWFGALDDPRLLLFYAADRAGRALRRRSFAGRG